MNLMFFKDPPSSKMLHLSPKPTCGTNLMDAAFARPVEWGPGSSWHPTVFPFCRILWAVCSTAALPCCHALGGWECDVHMFKAEVCEACLVLPKVLEAGCIEALGLVRQKTDGAYVRAAVACRIWRLPPKGAQTYSLGRIGRDDLKFPNVMRLKYQTSPSPQKKGSIWGVLH